MNFRRGSSSIDSPEQLDERLIPSGFTFHPIVPPPVVVARPPLSVLAAAITSSNFAKASPVLSSIYQEYLAYEASGAKGAFVSKSAGIVEISQDHVGVDIRATGNIAATEAQLKQVGMLVTGVNATLGIIEGSLPISALPTVVNDAYVIGVTPIYYPGAAGPGAGSVGGHHS